MYNILCILRKELLELFNSRRLPASLFLIATLICVFQWGLIDSYLDRENGAERLASILQPSKDCTTPYSSLKAHAVLVPSILEMFNLGVRSEFSSHFVLSRISYAEPAPAAFSETPSRDMFQASDLRLVFQWVFPLIALVLSYSMLSQEKESRTLSLVCSYPLAKSSIIIGKLMAGCLAMMFLILVAHALVLVLLILRGIPLPMGFWDAIIQHMAVTFLWTSFFILLGLCLSSITLSSDRAIILSLAFWLGLTIVLPGIVPSMITGNPSYMTQTEFYQTIAQNYANLFRETQALVADLGVSFASTFEKYYALQAESSDVALSLPIQQNSTKITYHSDGTLVVRSENPQIVQLLVQRLSQFDRNQEHQGRLLHSRKMERILNMIRSGESIALNSMILPSFALETITGTLANSDMRSYLATVKTINARREQFFQSLRRMPEYYGTRFFTPSTQGTLSPCSVVWTFAPEKREAEPVVIYAWFVLASYNLILLLLCVIIFLKSDPR